MKNRLYCYVDETGQDTQGGTFIVVSVVVGQDIVQTEQVLAAIERSSGKNLRKWGKAGSTERNNYLGEFFLKASTINVKIFYEDYQGNTDYGDQTRNSIVKALQAYFTNTREQEDYGLTVVVDGLNDKEKMRLRKTLSMSGFKSPKVAGARDQASALIRLADAMAGMIRDAEEGDPRLIKLLSEGEAQGVFYEL